MAFNAVVENRFQDAGYYHFLLATVYEDQLRAFPPEEDGGLNDQSQQIIVKYTSLQEQAQLYHSYDAIHRYVMDPFTNFTPEALFHTATYLHNCLPKV